MATFVLIHGGGSTSWDWHLVSPLLKDAGHDAVAVDLPIEDPNATLDDYVRSVVVAVGARTEVIVVGHSLGGFTAPLACAALDAVGLVFLTAMIPAPGESFMQWWANTGHDQESVDDDPAVSFYNGVPDSLVAEAQRRERDQQGAWMSDPWPAERFPDVPTCAVVCRDDQFFPAQFMRRQISDRLSITPVEIPGGHYAPLTHPGAIATALTAFADRIASAE